jgi:hypothetical protein
MAVTPRTGRERVAEHISSAQQCFQPLHLWDTALQWLLCKALIVTSELWEEKRFEEASKYSGTFVYA